MSRAVFTVSTTRPMNPGDGGSSSLSSKGMNIPDAVLRSPLDSSDATELLARNEYGSEAVGVLGRLPP